MQYVVHLKSTPLSAHAYTACCYLKALIEAQHHHRLTLLMIFFHQDAVFHALRVDPHQDLFADGLRSNIPFYLCSTSVHKRGIPETLISPPFHLAGLGTLAQGVSVADRYILL
jgi:sulfur relay (sulfurtransferase) complex TusBCD TusD component (DsrE family)